MAFEPHDKICQRCGDSYRIYSPQQLQKKYCNNSICADKTRWIAYQKRLQKKTA